MMKNKPLPPKKATDRPLRLFAVQLPNGKLLTAPTNEPMYFTDKKVAKTYRDKNGGIVVVGPDHRRHPEYQLADA